MFLALVLKHHVLSTLVDWGYSAARHPTTPAPAWPWLRQISLETITTLYVCHGLCPTQLWVVVSIEILLMMLTCMLERLTPLRRALRMHVYCEGAMLAFYLIVAFSLPLGL